MSVSVYLTIDSSVLTPSEMGNRMGMMDKCAFAGEAAVTGRLREANRWEIVQQVNGEFSTLLPEETLDQLFERIKGREEVFAEIAKTGSATLQICIMSDGYPGFILTPRHLAIMNRLGVTFDLDLYCDPGEEA